MGDGGIGADAKRHTFAIDLVDRGLHRASPKRHAAGGCTLIMQNPFIPSRVVAAVLLTGLSACSTIKSWFPDKERDYQFTSELPELQVPEDLKHKGLVLPVRTAGQEMAKAEVEGQSRYATENSSPPEETGSKEDMVASAPLDGAVESQTNQTAAETGSSLQIDQPKTQAARIVGRALSRKKLEVVERNVDKGYFYVKFDPNAVQATDETIWDELNFLFGDDPSQEQEYRISVQQIGPQLSQVIVQDTEEKTLSNKAANALLELIVEAINEDEQSPAAPSAPAAEQSTSNNPVNSE